MATGARRTGVIDPRFNEGLSGMVWCVARLLVDGKDAAAFFARGLDLAHPFLSKRVCELWSRTGATIERAWGNAAARAELVHVLTDLFDTLKSAKPASGPVQSMVNATARHAASCYVLGVVLAAARLRPKPEASGGPREVGELAEQGAAGDAASSGGA